MTTVAIMQPTYLPWCGFFDLLDQSDVCVLLDTVAVSKQSWQTRNRIRARDGNVVWLSVPTNATPGMPLNNVRIAYEHAWQLKHWRTLGSAYGHAPYAHSVQEAMWPVLSCLHHPSRWRTLDRLNAGLIRGLAGILRTKTKLKWASNLKVETPDPIERLADICRATKATEYLSPAGARGYLEGHDIGVPIRWHEYEHPVYSQGGAEFVSHLSVVDLLAWHGPASLDIIRSGRV